MSRGGVAVLGGGVAGLTAAHELAERGFDVVVVEAKDRFGGKARSMPGPHLGGDRPLPAEHGFRFFPGFYRHVTDSMARIPHGDGTTADNLVETTSFLQAVVDGDVRQVDIETPSTLDGWRRLLGSLFAGSRVPADETAYFVNQLLYFLTSCEERRHEEFETTSWWEFIAAGEMSENYRRFMAHGLTRTMVAMRPEVSSARTIGRIYFQLLRGTLDPTVEADRVLNAPTSEAWIDPWVRHLTDLGVDLRAETRVRRIYADGRRVTGVEVDGPGGASELRTDHYVAALPLEVLNRLRTPELDRTAPSLSDLEHLDVGWMNGVQFYLSRDVPAAHGHTVFYDSPWALTAVSQRQFWEGVDLAARGDGSVEGILSVNVSDWDRPGILYDKPARECTREEVVAEVWAQMATHFDGDEAPALDEADIVDVFVDPALSFGEDGVENGAPLLINTVDSLQYRPGATTEAENFYLAADYVRTNTDLASMEAASEAARRAVNGILDAERVRDECAVWDLEEPKVFEGERQMDFVRYSLGLPHPAVVGQGVWGAWKSLTG